jgi:hypothetical protein
LQSHMLASELFKLFIEHLLFLLQRCYTCRRVSSTSNFVKQDIIFIDQGRVREFEGFKFLSQSLYGVNLIFNSLCHLVVLGFLALLGHQALVIINTES